MILQLSEMVPFDEQEPIWFAGCPPRVLLGTSPDLFIQSPSLLGRNSFPKRRQASNKLFSILRIRIQEAGLFFTHLPIEKGSLWPKMPFDRQLTFPQAELSSVSEIGGQRNLLRKFSRFLAKPIFPARKERFWLGKDKSSAEWSASNGRNEPCAKFILRAFTDRTISYSKTSSSPNSSKRILSTTLFK